jgi:hypothetical protein
VVYSLTAPAIELVPLLVAMGSWVIRHATPSRELAIRAGRGGDTKPSQELGTIAPRVRR